MDYEVFKKTVEEMVIDGFFGDWVVTFQKVFDTNEELDSMCVRMEQEKSVTPNFYLNKLYQRYCNGEDIEEILTSVKEFVLSDRMGEDIDVDVLLENTENRIIFSLINAEKNRELLEEVST